MFDSPCMIVQLVVILVSGHLSKNQSIVCLAKNEGSDQNLCSVLLCLLASQIRTHQDPRAAATITCTSGSLVYCMAGFY